MPPGATITNSSPGKKWGDSHNYSLCLDTGLLGHDTCIQLICEAARKAEAFQ